MKTYAESLCEQRLKDLKASLGHTPKEEPPVRTAEEIMAENARLEIEVSDELRMNNLEYMQSKFPQDTSHKEG